MLLFSPTCSLFVWGRLLKKNEKKLAQFFNFTFLYINDVLSLNNSRFSDFIDRLYPIELEIKWQCRALRTKLYDKRDDFNFPFVKFPFLCSKILQPAPAYGVYISQLIQYSRACGSNFLDRGLLLTGKLLTHGFLLVISWSHHYEHFTVVTMTLLTVIWNIYRLVYHVVIWLLWEFFLLTC